MGNCMGSKDERVMRLAQIQQKQKAERKSIDSQSKLSWVKLPVLIVQHPGHTPKSNKLASLTAKSMVSESERIKVKIPTNSRYTNFKWVEEPTIFYPRELRDLSIQQIRQGNFQQKLCWFRMNLEKRRISWQEGSEVLKVDRWNILFSSIQALQKLNIYKEIKVQFNDQIVSDAGGLLREWMHLCIKEIMSPQTGVFAQCVTEETAYKIVWDLKLVEDMVVGNLEIMGLIIGKAIFQRISLNCFLNRSIIRQLCGQPVHLSDVYSFDRDFYKAWVGILTQNHASQLQSYFCAYPFADQNNELIQVELIKNGKNIAVTDENKSKYIQGLIHLYCTKSIQNYITVLRDSLHKVIPEELLSVFEPHQFEMILNGPADIDVKNWRQFTNYEGFKKDDEVIQWFWEEVEQYGQDYLKNLLHYCTGCTRVPVLGFKYLESNRGEIKPFTIRQIDYNKGNPYPKAHTCFNRLEMPKYSSREELSERLRVIMVEELNNFGLD